MNLVFTGGGTGGHLVIAQSLAIEAKKRGHTVFFIGSTYGQDKSWFEGKELFSETYFLDTHGFVNQKGFKKLSALWRIAEAVYEAKNVLFSLKTDAVISVGGYSAAGATIAAGISKIPFFIHEQNAVNGLLNTLLKERATGFFSSHDTKNYTDYPVKEIFFQNSRVRERTKTIIFLGGSGGASFINNLALTLAPWLTENHISIIHQCGAKNEIEIKQAYFDNNITAEVYGFHDDVASLFKRADFAVSRSGASTLWELCASGIPTFFIPYSLAANDHQFHNTDFLFSKKLCWRGSEKEINNPNFVNSLKKAILCDLTPTSTQLLKTIKFGGASDMIEQIETKLNLGVKK